MASGTRRRPPRVLVIDDNAKLGRALVRLLEAQLFYALAETDARLALLRILCGQTFDVILCDLKMPGMTGIEFHRTLVDAGSALAARVVFMTGGAPEEMWEYLDAVPNVCLHKPFDPADFFELVIRRAG